jgi:hypothetical protein
VKNIDTVELDNLVPNFESINFGGLDSMVDMMNQIKSCLENVVEALEPIADDILKAWESIPKGIRNVIEFGEKVVEKIVETVSKWVIDLYSWFLKTTRITKTVTKMVGAMSDAFVNTINHGFENLAKALEWMANKCQPPIRQQLKNLAKRVREIKSLIDTLRESMEFDIDMGFVDDFVNLMDIKMPNFNIIIDFDINEFVKNKLGDGMMDGINALADLFLSENDFGSFGNTLLEKAVKDEIRMETTRKVSVFILLENYFSDIIPKVYKTSELTPDILNSITLGVSHLTSILASVNASNMFYLSPADKGIVEYSIPNGVAGTGFNIYDNGLRVIALVKIMDNLKKNADDVQITSDNYNDLLMEKIEDPKLSLFYETLHNNNPETIRKALVNGNYNYNSQIDTITNRETDLIKFKNDFFQSYFGNNFVIIFLEKGQNSRLDREQFSKIIDSSIEYNTKVSGFAVYDTKYYRKKNQWVRVYSWGRYRWVRRSVWENYSTRRGREYKTILDTRFNYKYDFGL